MRYWCQRCTGHLVVVRQVSPLATSGQNNGSPRNSPACRPRGRLPQPHILNRVRNYEWMMRKLHLFTGSGSLAIAALLLTHAGRLCIIAQKESRTRRADQANGVRNPQPDVHAGVDAGGDLLLRQRPTIAWRRSAIIRGLVSVMAQCLVFAHRSWLESGGSQ